MNDHRERLTFTRLPGWTAYQLVLRGYLTQLAAAVFVLPIVFESYFPGQWYYWGGGFLAICVTLVVIGTMIAVRGNVKVKLEWANGYTTVPRDADNHPELFYLTGDDLQVISRPFAPRPRDGRRKVVRAFAGLPHEPLYRTRAGRPRVPVAPRSGDDAGRIGEAGPGNGTADAGRR